MSEANEEYFEYLFLDIEWNQTPGTLEIEKREPVQMAILATDENLQKLKSFTKAIRINDPKNLNEEMLKVTHTCVANVMAGNELEVVFQAFHRKFPTYGHIVVWTYDTYELFVRGMKQSGVLMKKHKVIVLQDILKLISGNSSKRIRFENALQCAQIAYKENFLHYSKHDTEYLFQLYKKCVQDYRDFTVNEMCVVNSETGRIHSCECRYVKKMNPDKMLILPKSSIFEGFSICKTCGTKKEWKKFQWDYKKKKETRKAKNPQPKSTFSYDPRELPLTEKNIANICKRAGLSYHMINNAVFVKSGFSSWIIYLEDDQVINLYHENYKVNREHRLKRQHQKFAEGYHKQELYSDNFYEVIQYIRKHEMFAKNRLPKKNRLEQLLDQIKVHDDNPNTNHMEDEDIEDGE